MQVKPHFWLHILRCGSVVGFHIDICDTYRVRAQKVMTIVDFETC